MSKKDPFNDAGGGDQTFQKTDCGGASGDPDAHRGLEKVHLNQSSGRDGTVETPRPEPTEREKRIAEHLNGGGDE